MLDSRTAAQDFVKAYEGDPEALQRLNAYYGRTFGFDDVQAEVWRRVYAFRQRSSRVAKNWLALEEAQLLVAQDAGFSSWEALVSGTPRIEPYAVDDSVISPRRRLSSEEWDTLIAVARERGVAAIETQGLMTDEVLARIVTLEGVTRLNLGGSRELTDDGLLLLERMPQLRRLDLSEYPGGNLTDRGLAVLRHLKELRHFEMTWQAGITDAGVANLRGHQHLETVNLMGSPTGDGAIEALAGLPALRHFSTGRQVTDAGLARLGEFPRLKSLAGDGARLLIDGPFSDAGLAGLTGLQGVAELDLFWHVTELTGAGFAHLRSMPNLRSLGCDGALSGDEAMTHIAAIPGLKRLRAQESAATEAGFAALAASRTLEGFWGRVCEGFGDRAFLAFSRMPALRQMGVGCAKVSDAALAALPQFPALRELTPIGFTDAGFRHVGACRSLERLTCMYCRETGDAATEQIAGLDALKYYYAGLTQITDRSLEILGGIESLEQVDLYECQHVTDAGLPALARLPRLREVHLDSLPGVTLDGTRTFPPPVRVCYTT